MIAQRNSTIQKSMFVSSPVILCLALLLTVSEAYGQNAQGDMPTHSNSDEPVAILAYYSNHDGLSVFNAEGFRYEHYFGMAMLPGDRIVSQDSSAELEIIPSGTLMRLSAGAEIRLDALQGRAGSPSTDIEMLGGRVRSVTGAIAGTRLQVRAGTVVGGVRGTDFLMDYEAGTRARLVVRSGEVLLSNLETGAEVSVRESQAADGLAEILEVVELSADELAQEFQDVEFQQLDPAMIPQPEPEPEPVPEPTPIPAPEPIVETPPVQDTDGVELLDRVAQYLGLQFGAVTIEGETYSRVVLEPRIQIGRFRAALYLPFIYQEDLFEPDEWYRPEGNNEWSFGSDYNWSTDREDALEDLVRDIALKIRYIEFAERGDPFFLRAGNLRDITLGYGILMNRYANDSDFPAVRRLGVNAGIDTTYGGLEAMTSDVVGGEISGARVYMRPAAPLFRAAMGLSAVADFSPSDSLEGFTDQLSLDIQAADPVLIGVGADINFPLLQTRPLSVILYSEVGGLVPYLREDFGDPEAGGVSSGLQEETVVDRDDYEFRNYGASAGVTGNIAVLDYRAEYRYAHGIFRHGFFDASYERTRAERVRGIMQYVLTPDADAYDVTSMGIYGEAGVTFFNRVRLEAGYLYPWELDESGDISRSDMDEALIRLSILQGWMPAGLYGSFQYRRVGFLPTILERGEFADADLFDHNTVMSGELVLPVAPAIAFAAGFSTTLLRDDQGRIVYTSDGRPTTRSSVLLETRVGY